MDTRNTYFYSFKTYKMNEKIKKAVQECVKESISVDKKNKKVVMDFGNFNECIVKKKVI